MRAERAPAAHRSEPERPKKTAGAGVSLSTLIGESPAFHAAMELAQRAARYEGTSILLTGETGTGKELFARAVHYASANAGEPFVAINCAAIPETLLESELFGHERGAFTDARVQKRGLLEVAGNGTVMLDEINELPLNLQPKLLRVLEERRVRRLGGLNEYAVGCRIIAAANRDLGVLVENGTFRSDLFYRLNVVRIELPPLRERGDDLDLLAHHFTRSICSDHGLAPKRLSPEAIFVFRSHPWLGNVRELKNTIESAVVMCDGDLIRPEHIRLRRRTSVAVSGDVILGAQDPVTLSGTGTPSIGNGAGGRTATPAFEAAGVRFDANGEPVIQLPPGGLTLDAVERVLIRETLRAARGNRSLAARMLGVSRPTIMRKIERYALD